MAKLNISKAARVAGVARITIQRKIKSSQLKCETTGDGKKLIDTTELLRVFGELKDTGDTPVAVQQRSEKLQQDTPVAVQLLQDKMTLLEQQVTDLKKDKEDLKVVVEQERGERQKLVAVIEKQMLLLPAPKTEEFIVPPHQAQMEKIISPQVVEKPDFAASPTQEGTDMAQDSSVNASEVGSKTRKQNTAPKKNAPQRQNKGKKKQGIFGFFSRK